MTRLDESGWPPTSDRSPTSQNSALHGQSSTALLGDSDPLGADTYNDLLQKTDGNITHSPIPGGRFMHPSSAPGSSQIAWSTGQRLGNHDINVAV